MLIEGDRLTEDSPILYILVILSMIGAYDIFSEILDNTSNVFSKNFTKKIILWAALYNQTKSIFYTSVISTCIVLAFPTIFFGKETSPRLEKQQKEKLK